MKKCASALLPVLLFALAAPSFAADSAYSIPSGTTVIIQLQNTLSTKATQDGDPFTGKVMQPVFANHMEAIPDGSSVRGHVTLVKEPGRVKGPAEMRLALDSITTPDGVTYSLSAGLEDVQGAGGATVKGDEGTIQGPGKGKKGTAVETGVGAAAGAGIGAIADGGTGALYGAGIGALAGIIHSLHKRHKDVTLPQGAELTFVLSRTVHGEKQSSHPKTIAQ